MEEYYLIAKIKSTEGPDGYVSIISFSDFPERFWKLKSVFIEIYNQKKEFFVEHVDKIKEDFVLKFRNFNTDKEADFLIGKEVFVDERNVVKLPEDTFFIHDLIGSTVFRNNEFFGSLTDVLSLPANDVFVIKTKRGEEILIPATRQFIDRYDKDNKKLDLSPGNENYYDDED